MKVYKINPITREIIPERKDAALGVYFDNKTDGAVFKMTGEIVHELSTFAARVNFMNFVEEHVDIYMINDVTIEGDTLTCSWVLDRRATDNVGEIIFSLCFIKEDGSEWNTTVFRDRILEGIEPSLTPEEEEQFETYYEMLVRRFTEEADAKKEEVLDSIPSDYTELYTDVEELRSDVDRNTEKIGENEIVLENKIDGAYADEEGYLYLTSNGVVMVGPIGPFAGGGGGGGSVTATMKMTNKTGWLTNTISEDADCVLQINWSSTEDDIPTGDGSISVRVGGVVKYSKNVSQGDVSVNIKEYLSAGTNSIRLTITDSQGNSRNLAFTVNVVSLSISSTFNDGAQYGEDVSFTYIPVGAVSKEVKFILDGELIGTSTVTASNRQQKYIIPKQSHGAHLLEVYFEAEIDGNMVESNHIFFNLMFVDEQSNKPFIASSYAKYEVEQYYAVTIPYYVYTPGSFTSDIKIYIDDVEYQSISVDRTKQIFSYSPSKAGVLSIKIATGNVEKVFNMVVTPSSMDVNAETEGLALYLSSVGRNNGEAHPESWVFNRIAASLENFNFTSDGWQLDQNNATCLKVSGDARVTIPYKIFEKDFKVTGKTIEFEFSTSDVRDYDTTLVSCMSGDVGLLITPQKVTLKSAGSEISTQYKEDEHVRISFVVEKNAENRLIYCYINGINSGIVQYPNSDNFSQLNPVNISIGSNDCTINLYTIRIYDSDLNRQQILDNWIADTVDGREKLARYERNKIFDEYAQIVIDKLPSYLPYMVLSASVLPQYKGDKKTVSGYFVNPQNPSKNFTFNGAQADVQGTSSQYYARKNYKIKYSNGFIDNKQVTSSKYAIGEDSIPVNTFTFKADVASSEGANNVELVQLYNDFCPVKTPPQKENAKVRQGIEGFPMVIFWDNGTEITFLGKYNFNNDKGTEDVFGFTSGDESWEILNNTSDRVIWKNDDYSGTDWLKDFEGRYPDGNTDPSNLSVLASWIKSTEGNIQKFKDEIEDYLDLDDTIFYYLFTELFLMVDSRAKNAFPTLYKNGKWMWLPYDMDTAIGINNEGALAFDYNLEDTDTTESGATVYNGQESVLWINLRQAFQDEIKAMYQSLRAKGLSYEEVEKRFEEHQSKWGEAIFNEDSFFKYVQPLIEEGEGSYLSMAQGSKAEQRKWWLYNRFRYLDAKYETGYAASSYINVRAYAVSDITVTPYADIYARAKWGSYEDKVRAHRNQSYVLHCLADTLNDSETMIYSADQLKSVGDLSGLKVGYANFAAGIKLQDIKIGDASPLYSNGNLTELYLGNNTLLKTLDVRNCPNLRMTVDISNCSNIEEVYFDGTSITGVELPNGGILKKLHLPGTITSLVLRNQTALTELVLASAENITTLWLENIKQNIIDPIETVLQLPANSRVRVIGFDKAVSSVAEIRTLYTKLDAFRGLDEYGNTTDKARISGTIHIESITGDEYAELKSRYADITIAYQHITTKLKFYNGSELIKTVEVVDGGNATYTGATPEKPADEHYVYSFIGWSKDEDDNTVDADALIAVTTNRNVYACYSAAKKCSVTYYNNGSVYRVENYMDGDTPSFGGVTPSKESTAQYSYRFLGWGTTEDAVDPNAFAVLHENRTLYAVYERTLRYYTVTWKDGSTTLDTEQYAYGSTPTYKKGTPTHSNPADYTFDGWTPAISVVSGDAVYTVKWKSLKVAIIGSNWSGSYLKSNATSLQFVKDYVPTTYDETWDASYDRKGTLTAYRTGTDIVVTWSGTDKIKCYSNISNMFYECNKLITLDLSSFDTSEVTVMNNMFESCAKLTTLNLSSFDTSKVTNMTRMFYNCQAITTLSLSSFDTSKVTDMASMFESCTKLTSLDLSSFDTSAVTSMSSMFYYCKALKTLILSSLFDTSAVTSMTSMFNECTTLEALDLSSFNTSAVTSMTYMFRFCSGLKTLTIPATNGNGISNTETTMYGKSTSVSITVSATGRTVILK